MCGEFNPTTPASGFCEVIFVPRKRASPQFTKGK